MYHFLIFSDPTPGSDFGAFIQSIFLFLIFLILNIISFIYYLLRFKKVGHKIASAPLLINIFTIIIFSLLSSSGSNSFLTDKNIVVRKRSLSPNRDYIIYDYQFDIGALGYTKTFVSVMAIKIHYLI